MRQKTGERGGTEQQWKQRSEVDKGRGVEANRDDKLRRTGGYGMGKNLRITKADGGEGS